MRKSFMFSGASPAAPAIPLSASSPALAVLDAFVAPTAIPAPLPSPTPALFNTLSPLHNSSTAKSHLYAFGNQHLVVVHDISTQRTLTVLSGHDAVVTSVAFLPSISADAAVDHAPRLISGDVSGTVIVWDVARGLCLLRTQVDKSPISQIIAYSPSIVLVVSNMTISLLNIERIYGRIDPSSPSASAPIDDVRHWRTTLTERIVHCALNPHNESCLVVLSERGLLSFVRDLNARRAPEVIEAKMRISSSQPSQQQPKKEDDASSDYVQVEFYASSAYPVQTNDIVFVMLKHEIVVLDAQRSVLLGNLPLPRGRAQYLALLLAPDDPLRLFTLHADGSVTAFSSLLADTPKKIVADEKWSTGLLHSYSPVAVTDCVHSLRRPRRPLPLLSMALFSFALGPKTLVLASSDGRIWTWEYGFYREGSGGPAVFRNNGLPARTPSTTRPSLGSSGSESPSSSSVPGRNEVKKVQAMDCSFLLSSVVDLSSSPANTVAVPHTAAAESTSVYVGGTTGAVAVIDVAMIRTIRMFEVFATHQPVISMCPLGHLSAVIACTSSSAAIVDTLHSKVTHFPPSATPQKKALRAVHACASGEFVMLVFEKHPPEIWKVSSSSHSGNVHLSMVRVLGTQAASLASFHPSRPQAYVYAVQGDTVLRFGNVATGDIEEPAASQAGGPSGKDRERERERRSFSVNPITALDWTTDAIVGGDNQGILYCWDLIRRKSKSVHMHRSAVLKCILLPIPSPSATHSRSSSPTSDQAQQQADGSDFFPSLAVFCLFADHAYGIFDIATGTRVALIASKSPQMRAIDIALLKGAEGSNTVSPVVVTETGNTIVFDKSLFLMNRAVQAVHGSLCPALMTPDDLLRRRFEFMWGTANDHRSLRCTNLLPVKPGVRLRRALTAAQEGGDPQTIRFWRAVEYWIFVQNGGSLSSSIPDESDEDRISRLSHLMYLSAALVGSDISFMDAVHARASEYSYLKHSHAAATKEKKVKEAEEWAADVARELVAMGDVQSAVDALLETAAHLPQFRLNMWKAVTLAHAQLHAAAVTQVATRAFSVLMAQANQLLATGPAGRADGMALMTDAVDLLLYERRPFEACGALQSVEMWTEALRIAKPYLSDDNVAVEMRPLFQRLARHIGFRDRDPLTAAILLLTCCDSVTEALSTLQDARMYDLCALMILVFEESVPTRMPPRETIEEVFVHCGTLMRQVGLEGIAAECWKQRAGEVGLAMAESMERSMSTADLAHARSTEKLQLVSTEAIDASQRKLDDLDDLLLGSPVESTHTAAHVAPSAGTSGSDALSFLE